MFPSGRDWELRFNRVGMGHMCREGHAPQKVSDIFVQRVVRDASGASLFVDAPGGRRPLHARPEAGRYISMTLARAVAAAPTELNIWRLPWHAPGLTLWWDIPPLFCAVSGDKASAPSVGEAIRNSWVYLCEVVLRGCPCLSLLAQGDRP